MKRFPFILTFVLILLSLCLGQERGGTDRTVAVPLLERILGGAHASGSLAYWGRCELGDPYPDFPALSSPSDDSRPPSEVLWEVFSKDRQMQVTQESNGLIRMFETDVPMDLLDVRISHLSFGSPDEDRDIYNGPTTRCRQSSLLLRVRHTSRPTRLGLSQMAGAGHRVLTDIRSRATCTT